ncbi:hypothetical protein CARUB_v10016035mg, partial [Capsella rubella]
MCTIYAIDTDWAWYYISCVACNKKVTPIHPAGSAVPSNKDKPKFWCDNCRIVVTRVVAKYMLYAKVMDATGESKCLLFDTVAEDIIGASAKTILGGSLQEIDNPDDIPDQLKNLVGKTFLFLVAIGKENIWGGKDTYKVSKVLQKDGLLVEETPQESTEMMNPATIVSGDQVFTSVGDMFFNSQLLITYSQETTESNTPSSKRVYAANNDPGEQTSTSKK